MKLHMIATRDIVANVYSAPMFVPHIGLSIRSFGDECRRKEKGNVLGEHPEDFELMHLGVYYDENGTFDLHEGPDGKPNDTGKPVQIAVGANYRE